MSTSRYLNAGYKLLIRTTIRIFLYLNSITDKNYQITRTLPQLYVLNKLYIIVFSLLKNFELQLCLIICLELQRKIYNLRFFIIPSSNMHKQIAGKSNFEIAQRVSKTYSPFLSIITAFTVEFRIGFARSYTAADISPIVISIYHAVNVTLLRYVRHHEGLRARNDI